MVSQDFQKQVAGIWPDDSRDPIPPAGPAVAAAKLSLAGLRPVPHFPELRKFLEFLAALAGGPLFGVTVAHAKLIKPADFRAVDGVFRLH